MKTELLSAVPVTALMAGPGAVLRFPIYAEAQSIEDLQAELLDLTERAETIQANADGESRDLSEDEQEELERIFGEYDAAETKLKIRRRIAGLSGGLAESLGRRTQPEPPEGGTQGAAPVLPAQQPGTRPSAPAQPRSREETERWGWPSLGHFAMAVRRAHPAAGMQADPRLFRGQPTTVSTEGVGEDGGFAVPPEFRREITQLVFGEESLVARTDLMQSGSNVWTAPKDETTPWQSTGGIQANWEGEGSQLDESKAALKDMSVRLNKLTALVPVTSELMEDAPGMDSYLRRKAPEKMDFKITDALISGSGAGQPLGILNAPCLVTVAKEGGQAADTLVFNNINNMWARMYARWRSSAVWLINQDIEPQLISLNHPGDSSPMYVPPGGLSAAPYGTILGRPVVPTEACSTLGDVGDIILASMGQYLAIQKVGGVRTDVSIHLWFNYDTTAFRFILRLGGQPWLSAPIARFKGGNTLSSFVTLAERA